MRRRVALVLAAMALAMLLASGVAWAVTEIGGPGSDVLVGTDRPDLLDGRSGDDVIYGKGGDDSSPELPELRGFLIGGKGEDVIYGGSGDDFILGGGLFTAFLEKGEDVLYGEAGDDIMQGGQGADVLYGNGGRDILIDAARTQEGAKDKLFGGRGDDLFDVDNRPAATDFVYCEEGVDLVDADRKDVLFDCERRGTVGE